MRISYKISVFVLLITLYSFSCNKETLTKKHQTENVIVVVMDGARYSETWGDSARQYIPRLSGEMAKYGVVYTHFYNNGSTYSISGHAAITTGNYEEIDNSGSELSQYPSFFQYWNKKYGSNENKCWIIASKEKIEVLSDCQLPEWKGLYKPLVDCGVNGIGSGYRHDSITFNKLISVLSEFYPHLVLVNLREPDYSAHSGNWESYTQGIMGSDEYIYKIWEYIQTNPYYKGTTAMFVTNDHGRHLDTVADGFISHGDSCEGCRHISLYAFGPDFKQGAATDSIRELVNILPTIAELLQFENEYGKSTVMTELFK